MKWAVWNTIKVVVLWVVWAVVFGWLLFLIIKADSEPVKDSSLDVEHPTSTPAIFTMAASKEPIVPAASNEPRYAASNLYARDGLVTGVDTYADTVTFVDTRGLHWEFYGAEDWYEGDRLCAIFYDAGTLNPYDDEVIVATYEAYDY